VNKYNNIVILRTFSKAYALGGIRIGYGLMPPEIRNTLNSVKQPYNVNVVGQKLALKVLDSPVIRKNIKKIIRNREAFFENLVTLGRKNSLFRIHKSKGSYILLSFIDWGVANNFYRFMKKNGILIRIFNSKNLEPNVRISIGQEDQMKVVISMIKLFLENGGKC
jgi:histidinol-phosphate aminotransferase